MHLVVQEYLIPSQTFSREFLRVAPLNKSHLPLNVGKSVAKEGAKKALEAGKSAAVDVGKKLVTKALMPKSKKILQKYTEPATRDINALIDGSAIGIQDLVKKLNSGAGIKEVV